MAKPLPGSDDGLDFTPEELLEIFRAVTALNAVRRVMTKKFNSRDSYALLCSSTSGLLMELIRAELMTSDIHALGTRMDAEHAAISQLPRFTLDLQRAPGQAPQTDT